MAPTVEDRSRGTQERILYRVITRLRESVDVLSEGNCFLSDQPIPPFWPQSAIVCTVSAGDGHYNEGMFLGSGHEQLCEEFPLTIGIFVLTGGLDTPGRNTAVMLGPDTGLITVYKPKILRALLVQKVGDEFVAWEACDNHGVPMAKEFRPTRCSRPQPTDDGSRLGIQIDFAVSFDWEL